MLLYIFTVVVYPSRTSGWQELLTDGMHASTLNTQGIIYRVMVIYSDNILQ